MAENLGLQEINSIGKHLEVLKTAAENSTAIIASIFPKASIYLNGGMARKLLANKERLGMKVFSYRSDLDLWVEFSWQDCNSAEKFKEAERKIKEELGKLKTDETKIDLTVMVNRGNGTLVQPNVLKEITELMFHESVEAGEMILLYENGKFFIPWKEG